MERLVVSWDNSDGFTYSCTITRPVSYESAEALYEHLHQAITNYLRAEEDFEVLKRDYWILKQQQMGGIETLQSRLKNCRRQEKAGILAKIQELQQQELLFPKTVQAEVVLGSNTFDCADFVSYNDETKKREVDMPRVQTLDEWFGDPDAQ